jgi:hypothetical protein
LISEKLNHLYPSNGRNRRGVISPIEIILLKLNYSHPLRAGHLTICFKRKRMPADNLIREIYMRTFLVFGLILMAVSCGNFVLAVDMPERQICQGSDDAEEDFAPSTVVDNTPLWACCTCPASGYICHITGAGLRFTDVQIPQGATIDSAWLTIMPFIITHDDIACTVYCEDVDSCTTFVQGDFHNVSNRTRTADKVIWYKRNAGSNWLNSCNLASIVEEVVQRPGWSAGNALAFIMIPGDSAGEWRSNLQLQAWELADHSYGAKFNCIYTASHACPDTEETTVEPVGFKLYQNHPNPFNRETKIRFMLERPAFVTLDIYNLLGRKVRTLISQHLDEGDTAVSWEGKDDSGKDACSGIYFYRIKVGNSSQTNRLLLLK